MARTRRHRGKKHGTLRSKCEHPATMHGLNKWYEKMFEELGWMVLANKKGMDDKVKVYKHSLERLKTHLECKIHSVHDHDREVDLNILLENVKILIAHVHKDF
jgi:hypothetical protein